MKVACRCIRARGGSCTSGVAASPNGTVRIALRPPRTKSSRNQMPLMISTARRTSGESNGNSPRVQASYCSGVAVRSRMSSIQSVATQPVAPELSMPIDQGT